MDVLKAATRLALEERRRWDGAWDRETRDSDEWWMEWLLEGIEVRAWAGVCVDALLWRGKYCVATLCEGMEEEMASCP